MAPQFTCDVVDLKYDAGVIRQTSHNRGIETAKFRHPHGLEDGKHTLQLVDGLGQSLVGLDNPAHSLDGVQCHELVNLRGLILVRHLFRQHRREGFRRQLGLLVQTA